MDSPFVTPERFDRSASSRLECGFRTPECTPLSHDSLETWWSQSEGSTRVVRTRTFSLASAESTHDSEEPEEDGANVVPHFSADENLEQCYICETLMRKRRPRSRHHCRICNRTVCNDCSPNNFQLESGAEPQHACTPCVARAFKAQRIKAKNSSRLICFGEQLHALVDSISRTESTPFESRLSQTSGNNEDGDLEWGITFCEAVICSLTDVVSHHHDLEHLVHRNSIELRTAEDKCSVAVEKRTQIEFEMELIRDASVNLCTLIHSLVDAEAPAGFADAAVADVLQLCEKALAPFKDIRDELVSVKRKAQGISRELARERRSQEQLAKNLLDVQCELARKHDQLSGVMSKMQNIELQLQREKQCRQSELTQERRASADLAMRLSDEVQHELTQERQARAELAVKLIDCTTQCNVVERELIQERQARAELVIRSIEVSKASFRLSCHIHSIELPEVPEHVLDVSGQDARDLCDGSLARLANDCDKVDNIQFHMESMRMEIAHERLSQEQIAKRCKDAEGELLLERQSAEELAITHSSQVRSIEAMLAGERQVRDQFAKELYDLQLELARERQAAEETARKLSEIYCIEAQRRLHRLVGRFRIVLRSWWIDFRLPTILVFLLHLLILWRASHSKRSAQWHLPALPTVHYFCGRGSHCKAVAPYVVNSLAHLVQRRCTSASCNKGIRQI